MIIKPSTIYLASDHGGYDLKEKVKPWLEAWGYQFEDLGPSEKNPQDDYPDYAIPLAEKVATDADAVGVLLCRSGGGMIIAANKVRGIRAVEIHSKPAATHAKEHNDANVISLAADWIDETQAKEALKTFLETPFSEAERHQRRLAKIATYEQKHD